MKRNPDGEAEKYVPVGKIRGPWGLKGEAKLELYRKDSKVLFETRQIYLKAGFSFRELSVLSVRPQGKNLCLRLDGFHLPEDVLVLKGSEVYILAEELPEKEEGEYYAFELVGMEVVTSEGASLGQVRDVVHYGASEILVVREAEKGKEIQIPLIPDYLREISVKGRRIVVEGVDELL